MKSYKLFALTAVMATAVAITACMGKPDFIQKRETLKNSVVLINTFEVPKGQEANALASWQASRDFLKTQNGYISTTLHQNLNPDGKYHLVNVARWASVEDFNKAISNMNQTLSNNKVEGVVATPSLFKVIDSDVPFF